MKRFATIFLVFCLALAAPVAAIAQTAGTGRSEEDVTHVDLSPVFLEDVISDPGVTAQLNALDQNGKVQLKAGNHVRYIDRIDIPDYAMALYEALEEGSDGDGVADILIDVTKAQSYQGNYVLTLAKFSGSYSDETDRAAKFKANSAEASAYAYAVVGAFDRDHPEVFWLNSSWSISNSYTFGSGNYTQTVYLILKGIVNNASYDIRCDGYTDPTALKAAIAERDANVQAILNKTPSTAVTDAEKMRYFNEWLTKNNEYNTAVSAGNGNAAWDMAWECISALQGNTGNKGPVCEGYARAFQLLCMRSGIPCVLVSGNTVDINTGKKNGHMWNYVQLEGSWYGVDVTWNDPTGGKSGKVSGFEREDYLFVGAGTVVSGSRTFLAEHPEENSVFTGSVSFTNGPVLSNTAYDNGHTHTFGTPTFRWASDGKSATAVFTCTQDPTHTMELPADVTSAVKTKATCEGKGTTTYTSTVKLDSTSYTSTKNVQDIPALGHDWGDWTETKAPTDTEKGEEVRTCKRDPSHTETRSIPEGNHVHSLTLVPAKASTATEAGHEAYYVCSGCDRWFRDSAGTQEIADKDSVILPAGQFGDIDGNGVINALDYMLLKRYVLGTFDLTDAQKAVADVNHDKGINAMDYLLLKRHVLGTYVIT